MWSKLLYFFGMDKSLKLDETTYPFVPCHDFCENDCTADVYFTKKVRERFKEIGIEKDRGNMFLSLLSYISKEKHSFLNLESKDEEVDKYLKCMKVFSSSDVKKIFRHYLLTEDSTLNNCRCCSVVRGRVLHVQLQHKYETFSYTYFTFSTLHGSQLCLTPGELLDSKLRLENGCLLQSSSLRELQKGDCFFLTLSMKKYLNILEETVDRYVQVQRPSYLKLPHATALMMVAKMCGKYDRKQISPIGQLMDSWVLEKRDIYFLSAESTCAYDHRVGFGQLQQCSKWVPYEDVYKLQKFVRDTVEFHGTLIVPESSALFEQYLMKRHSPKSIAGW